MSDDVRFAQVETALGPTLIAATRGGIAAISRALPVPIFLAGLARRYPAADPVEDEPALRGAVEWLTGYLAGDRRDLPPVDLGGLGPWDRAVYAAVRAIRYGETATYGEVALTAGSPGGARAVGGSLSRCPLFPAVPCQRVVLAADGFSGWGGGDIAVKRRLLEMERAARPVRAAASR
jgi:methylated-DNA-[protein]-cysteine S-methyltransferase